MSLLRTKTCQTYVSPPLFSARAIIIMARETIDIRRVTRLISLVRLAFGVARESRQDNNLLVIIIAIYSDIYIIII